MVWGAIRVRHRQQGVLLLCRYIRGGLTLTKDRLLQPFCKLTRGCQCVEVPADCTARQSWQWEVLVVPSVAVIHCSSLLRCGQDI